MSGGHFEYKQFHIEDVAEKIKEHLKNQGELKDDVELLGMRDYYETYPDEKYNGVESKDVQDRFKEAIRHLELAKIYTHRIDWYLSGDDGEESFLERLEDEIREFNKLNSAT